MPQSNNFNIANMSFKAIHKNFRTCSINIAWPGSNCYYQKTNHHTNDIYTGHHNGISSYYIYIIMLLNNDRMNGVEVIK